MIDAAGRVIDYMRISITDRCNLRCRYCMPDGITQVSMAEILTYEEIRKVCILAAELGITPIYAGQLFKKETGQTFSSYLTQCRLAKAQRLLETGKYKISEVSELVGYQSISYFSRTFKRVTGRTPYSVLSSAHAKQRP